MKSHTLMKLNFVNFFDRVAITLVLPFAILGYFYAQKEYIPKKTSIEILYLTTDYPKAQAIYDSALEKGEPLCSPRFYKGAIGTGGNPPSPFFHIIGNPLRKGVLANGQKELSQIAKDFPLMKIALDRAYAKNGDQDGTLVNSKEFGYDSIKEQLLLLPSSEKRFAYTSVIVFIFCAGLLLLIGSLSRITRWVFKGLSL